MNRRTFLSVTAGVAGLAANEPISIIPIIDTHIHLFDPNRPQGIPWPDKSDTVLYRAALPGRYRKVTRGLGVVGAIEVECSPWLEDNQWVLDVAAKDTIIVGTIGDLEPASNDFASQLERFHHNPLFRGIRYGNLWGRSLSKQLSNPQFVDGLKRVAEADLVMDTANPDPELIAAVLRLSDQVPRLRIVIDHLPQMEWPASAPDRAALNANLQQLGKRPQVYVKVSEVLKRPNGRLQQDLGYYKALLDQLWDTFGADRLVYGSDWPNCDHIETVGQELKLVRQYFMGKGHEVAEKYFWKNSVAAYRWVKRAPDQPQLA